MGGSASPSRLTELLLAGLCRWARQHRFALPEKAQGMFALGSYGGVDRGTDNALVSTRSCSRRRARTTKWCGAAAGVLGGDLNCVFAMLTLNGFQ